MTYYEKPDTPEEALEHYGVPGMKWGVRRSPEQLAARKDKSLAKREKLATKAVTTTAKVDKANRRQNEAMYRAARSGRKKDRKVLAKRLKKTNRAIRRDERVDRHIKKIDKRVKNIDRRIEKLGRMEIERQLKEAGQVPVNQLHKRADKTEWVGSMADVYTAYRNVVDP